jgi:hypothetical protein
VLFANSDAYDHFERVVPRILPSDGFEYAAALAMLVCPRMFRLFSFVRVRDPTLGWDSNLMRFDAPCADLPPTPSIPSFQPDPRTVEWVRYGELGALHGRGRAHVRIWSAGQERYVVDG